jgi:hypothetical protein
MKLPPIDKEAFYSTANKAGMTIAQADEMLRLALAYGRAVQEECADSIEQKRRDWMTVKWPDQLQGFGSRIFDACASAIRSTE